MTERRADAPSPTASESSLRRRDVLVGAGAFAALAAAPALAAEHEGDAHAGHEGHGKAKYFEAKAAKAHPALVAATRECLGSGETCISHCFETFRAGDTTMADCAFAVQQMLHVCTAFSYLASYDSKHLRAFAPVCIQVCLDCEEECRKHEEHQAECKACADACAALVKEAKKLGA
jgi:Cys-rich four helix bundle protein (predicted Tat secretion target)